MPHTSRRRSIGVALALTFATVACSDMPTIPGEGRTAIDPARTIFDAAHAGNVPGFFFLPPMVPDPSASGVVDPLLQPTVQICALQPDQASCSTVQPAGFPILIPFGAGGVGFESDVYHANWQTSDYVLDEALYYRITVRVGDRELGFADVDVVDQGNQLKNVDTGEYIPLKDGRTLPIKFRVETGIAGRLTVSPATAVIAPTESQVFEARGADLHGVPLSGLAVEWSVESTGLVALDPAAAATDEYGLVTSTAQALGQPGVVTVVASAQGLTASAVLTIRQPPPPVDGLLAYYPFNGNATDETGNGHDGTVLGPVLTSDRFGAPGAAYSFDGIDDQILVGDYFGALPAMSVSVWVNMDEACLALNKWCTFVSKTIEGAYQQNFQKTFALIKAPFAGTTNWFDMRVYGPEMFDAIDAAYSGPMEAGRWYHLVATYDAQDVRLYLDDALVAVTPRIGDLHANATPLVIGAIATGGNVMQGALDDIRIYGRALDASEVGLLNGELPGS